ncbi:MAG: hypothetical protein RL154_383 [Pseudomonadota bacterium]|jgi:hypothetical protein
MSSVKRNRILALGFVQMSDLCMLFGVSSAFFKDRVQLGLLKQNVHFFSQRLAADAKKSVVLWDIEAVRQFIKANPSVVSDNELQELLSK